MQHDTVLACAAAGQPVSACTTSTSDLHSPSHMPPTIIISSPNKFAVWPVRRGGAEAAFRKEVTEQVTIWIFN